MLFRNEIASVINTLNQGGTIIYPTDTIWGIGCDPFNEAAVGNLFYLKQRPRTKPILLLVDSIEMLKQYVTIHPRVETLLVYHRQPLTLIYKADKRIPPYLTSESGTIGIRVVLDHFCKEVIKTFKKPITSTSANFSGSPFPNNFDDIASDFLNVADYVVKHKQQETSPGKPSVIASFNGEGELTFFR